MMLGVVLVFAVGLIQSGVTQLVQDGLCDPNVSLQQGFDVARFSGVWYEVARLDGDVRGVDCSSFEFAVSDSGIQVKTSGVNANFAEERNGTATLETGTAKLTLDLSSPSDPFDFWILTVEYDIFALAFNCENISPSQSRVNVWQLGRTPEPPTALMQVLMNNILVSNLGLTIDQLRTVEHSEDACYVLPIIEEGEPIVLPGQCDNNITVVQNFDATRFIGVWHEIYSYESENSLNLCSRAEYTAGDDVILVENSQVVNQTLQSVFGSAVVVSTDGSAQLSVTLNVGPINVTSELKILATDYNSYAVSYTCQDLPDNTKRIYSWILGRSRVLSAEAQSAVNRVVESEIVLNFEYYRQTDQSDEACFFFPEYVPDTPVVFRGLCDVNIPAIANFDPERYEGIWHDIESYHSAFQTGTCRNAEYQLTGDSVNVLNTQVLNQTLDSIVGEARVASTDGSGKLDVTFPIAGTNFTVTSDYWILDTDYTSYALVYSCVNLDENERQVWSWKLSRTKELTQEARDAINNVTSNIPVLDDAYYQRVDQSEEGCFFFPEPQLGVPVVFPGQCDNNTSVVQNFDLNQFSGIWHEIEAYPKVQQQGVCINHDYTIGPGNSLILESSQITDQFLSVSNGTLSFASNDNSAKMNIDISVDGETITIPFWVLDTDYNNYALAYSCVQLNSDFRGIYSWKLSRTKQLTNSSVVAIDNVISEVEVLGQEYYEAIDQSDEACFYLPDLEPGEPVVLFGQCDPNITVVQNFDAERYLGIWHIVESYPSDSQSGTCNRADYLFENNGNVSVANIQVVNETLNTVIGSVIASVDGSGKLTVTYPNASSSSDYWILDTDYDSYALVYSCEDISSDQRRVWSWKLSRTNTLTESAVNAINVVVDSINVLNNRYYYSIDHSDEGCFYFPEPSQGIPVVFPGRCDQNITGVANFDVVRYLGTWHNIELYPSAFQEGTCSNSIFDMTPGSLDSITVDNNQVLNRTLDTTTSSVAIASVDGSGKLDVTFRIPGSNETVTLSLLVLDTDYDSYSLVYACQDFGEVRQVWSWKLSRMKELSTEATLRIDSVIAAIQVLEDKYYWPVDQSDSGCFYFPEPILGEPVHFPGRCSDDIPVVQNFNFIRFQGVWHELSSYPTGEDLGECSRQEYSSATAGNLTFHYGNVRSQSLSIVEGSLGFDPNYNVSDGRLLISIPFFTSALEIPFWVLDVDYEDYAIVYGCMDLDPPANDVFERAVYSWKLSRSRQLSPTANAAINNVISSVDVLSDQYYEDVDHTDEACFYLPEPVVGEQVLFRGQCDTNITTVENFNATEYLGRWYLIESYPSAFQNGTCSDARYSLAEDGSVDVLNTEVVDQTLDSIVGTAVLATDGSAKLLVTFPNAPVPIEYWILATDYTSYALVYSCVNVDSDQRAVWSWKLSRTQSLSSTANDAINQAIDKVNVLDNRYYETIDHSAEACFYFPEPDPNTQVRFRGQCNETIGVVQNFTAERYLGLWHLIESYPSAFQTGTCSNAYYSLGADVVDVFNTQVLNQTLDTMSGIAVASDDGSGILDVSFPIAGTNFTTRTPYWVLDTDYDSYALVYTCVQDGEYRQVWSWKLSRTKELSATAISAINNVTETIQVLDDRYYQPVDQSREGCFYYPEPQPGVPVVFPGQCENIDVVQNFNLTAFQGIWHEIEAYPKDQQQGKCVNHEYSTSTANTLDLLSSQIIDQTLTVSSGSLSFTSLDGSARLFITIEANGTVVNIPFWIVDTDYEDYALAYSCVNVSDDYRHVYSWKLSRSKFITSGAQVAIDNAMAAVPVLNNDYFEPVDQSDAACFFYPDLEAGEPVIFPGQCDDNIPVVQNFDAERYLNRWRLIETYTSDFQNGTCNEATYSLAEDGSVDVHNTQVVDQLLQVVDGRATIASTNGTGILEVTFPNSPESSLYYILATDYVSYSLVYSCRNINPEQRRVWAWKLSRERELSAAAAASISQAMASIDVVDDRYFEPVTHSDDACFYYPEPNGNPVVFRGQCDETIPVVNDFDLTRYQGLWYDVESYPQEFQDGTCPTATYTPDGDIVRVRNTQVRAQELDEALATAVLTGAGAEGKLEVTFPIAGTDLTVVTPYWVLATDYESFSLVYSCQNIDEEYRRVTSWKLSRTQNLYNESSIASAIADIPVLDQRYYQARNHSEEDCFYYPDNNGGPVILNGQCQPDEQVNVVTDFDPERFSGTWHEVARFPSELQVGACASSRYEYSQGALSVTMNIVNDEALTTVEGPVNVATNGSGILDVNLNGGLNINGKMYVLFVDYADAALLYSCRNIDNETMQVYSWKLSRSRSGISEASAETIDGIVHEESNLFFRYYDDTAQDNDSCFYYPIFEPLPDSIILPGPCDTRIRGIPDFNAERYLGQWFEIEKYPQPWQQGECHRAHYSSTGGAVAVLNTQVLNRTLLTQAGVADLATTDGTGQLTVTFEVGGVTNVADYYILATDYSNYALVYSCRNVGEDHQVSSWKLGRSRTLSVQATAAIDLVISTTRGLLQDYYTVTDQSQEACFYVPEVDPTQAVRLRGTCDNIRGQANFDVQRYLGWWHEIKSYPTGEAKGTCISTQYQQSGNQISFVDTQVFGLTGDVVRGTVTASSDGRLTKTFADGRPSQDIWVLATDYSDYSLVFSCEPVDDEYIQVWSSIQTKSRTLSSAAEEAVAAAVVTNGYLFEEFLLPVDQGDDACFHYPEQTGQKVKLPGQCNQDIPKQQDFDIIRYTGVWYQIERYPYPEVSDSSTCIGTRYTYDDASGVVDILSWEVEDEELNTIEGLATVSNTTASLQVVLPVPGSETETSVTDLHILTTDYASYALVYTCENVNQFEREVVAIKLSRTRTLPAPAAAAINTYMTSHPELHQPLFLSVEQNEECEEPNSSFLVKSSLVLVAICYVLQMLV